MRVRKLPAPSKPGRALFAAASLLAGSCQSRLFSIKLPRRRSVSRRGFVIPVSPASAADNCLRFAPFKGDCPSPAPYARMQRPGNPDADRKKPAPRAGLLYRNVHPASHPIQKPTGVLSEQVSNCLDGKCAGGLLYAFFRIFSVKSGVRRNCNRIVIIFLSNLSPIRLRKSPRKRDNDASSLNRLFIHRK